MEQNVPIAERYTIKIGHLKKYMQNAKYAKQQNM